MPSYRELTSQRSICLDRRDGIGPHHLAIGKTRKLFEWQGVVHAFFSTGYEIRHARVDAGTMQLIDGSVLPAPVAWGGGAFCVDVAPDGVVSIVFIHRNKLELALLRGKIRAGVIAWEPWRLLLRATTRMAAPWIEIDREGNGWCAVLSRDGGFKLALVRPDGSHRAGEFFTEGETGWYHSCVQVLPIGRGRAVAVGFRGNFPAATELVWKSVGADLTCGPSRSLAPCNVNDALTFHFQAVGDPRRGRAHIVYLDAELTVSHAMFDRNEWRVTKNVLARPAFAPQIAIDDSGALNFIAADYDGVLWTSAWTADGGWSAAEALEGNPAPNISAAFGRTGYGSGGLIGAARSSTGRVPFLSATIEDDASARASLHLSALGAGNGLAVAEFSVTVKGKTIDAKVNLETLTEADARRAGQCWLMTIPAAKGEALKIALLASEKGLKPMVFRQGADGAIADVKASARVEASFRGPFFPAKSAGLRAKITLPALLKGLNAGQAWVESYEGWRAESSGAGARLVDVAPFAFEAAAQTARDPASIPRVFRRII